MGWEIEGKIPFLLHVLLYFYIKKKITSLITLYFFLTTEKWGNMVFMVLCNSPKVYEKQVFWGVSMLISVTDNVSYLVLGSDDSLGGADSEKENREGIQQFQTFCKRLNIQSMWSILFLYESKPSERFNKLFRNHKHHQKILLYSEIRQQDVSVSLKHKLPPWKEKIYEKHQGGRRRVKKWICRTEEWRTFYFLGINIYTNIDFTNGGPFLPFIILFSLSGQYDAKQTQDEAGDMATIYATLLTHKSLV